MIKSSSILGFVLDLARRFGFHFWLLIETISLSCRCGCFKMFKNMLSTLITTSLIDWHKSLQHPFIPRFDILALPQWHHAGVEEEGNRWGAHVAFGRFQQEVSRAQGGHPWESTLAVCPLKIPPYALSNSYIVGTCWYKFRVLPPRAATFSSW